MFHPTIFDNIKVVLEGTVYDRDFDGEITVTDRADLVDLAAYHRLFRIDFQLANRTEQQSVITAQIQLRTSLKDIAGEQLELPLTDHIGCTICIHFLMSITDVRRQTEAVIAVLNEIWGDRPHITQTVSASIDEHRFTWPPYQYENRVTLDFHRKIDEGNIEDMRHLVDHCIRSLESLNSL